jgi:hypothetical protein
MADDGGLGSVRRQDFSDNTVTPDAVFWGASGGVPYSALAELCGSSMKNKKLSRFAQIVQKSVKMTLYCKCKDLH